MITKLKEMYQELLVENVKEFDKSHYYFYDNNQIFGISKTISKNEYNLLKKIYVEKPIYDLNKHTQAIYDYIYSGSSYPFKAKVVRVFTYIASIDDDEEITSLFESMLKGFTSINIYDYKLCFYEENSKVDLKELIDSLSFDLGYVVKLHEAFNITEKVSGSILENYIAIFNENLNLKSKDYSHFTDVIIQMKSSEHEEFLTELKDVVLGDVLTNTSMRDIVVVMMNNNLNVSSSAKLLYMNRNSLINKLDSFYKETGINLQRFTHACSVYFLMQIK